MLWYASKNIIMLWNVSDMTNHANQENQNTNKQRTKTKREKTVLRELYSKTDWENDDQWDRPVCVKSGQDAIRICGMLDTKPDIIQVMDGYTHILDHPHLLSITA